MADWKLLNTGAGVEYLPRNLQHPRCATRDMPIYRTHDIIQRFTGQLRGDQSVTHFALAQSEEKAVDLSMLTPTGWVVLERWAIGDYPDEQDEIKTAKRLLRYYTDDFEELDENRV